MALYTIKSREEALNPLKNYTGNNLWVLKQRSDMGYEPTAEQTKLFNAIGRSAGSGDNSASDDNFFVNRGKSIENALGTTGAAAVGGVNELIVNENRNSMRKSQKERMNDVAKKYGYNTYHDVWDAKDKAQAEGDKETLDKINNVINPELQAQANANKKEMDKFASDYKDYVKNDYIGKKTNQDRGKFAGSAIKTLSTAADVMMPAAGVAFNTVQGGIEGVADELEQNGLENFNAEQAGKNALAGAASGLVVGGLNKGVNKALAKRGGNLLKGGNKVTQALNNFNAKNPAGQIASTIGTGAARGALSGAVGGATGAGVSAALNNQDVLGSALEGARRGAGQGAFAGSVMSGANLVASKTPGVGTALRKFNEAGEDWNARKVNGEGLGERLSNTWDESTTKMVGDRIGQKVGNDIGNIKQSFKNLGEGLGVLADRANETPLRNIGGSLEIKDLPTKLPGDIQNMEINNNTVATPETKATVATVEETQPMVKNNNDIVDTEEVIDLTGAFDNNGLSPIQNRNKLQAVGRQLQNAAQTQKYSGIYDSLDASTAARAAETKAPQRLAELGVNSPDYNEYAKTSSYVNKVATDLAKKSGVKVVDPNLTDRLAADNLDIVMSDTALKKYNDYIRKIVPDGDSPSQYSAAYLLDKSRELGNKAANLRGNTDDVKALRQALNDAKYLLREPATKALENVGITGDGTNDMVANGLAKLGANEKVQDYYTDAVDGKAPSIADYIRRSSLFEQARDMGNQIDAEKYTRSASKAPTNPMTRIWNATGLDQPVNTILRNTVAPIASGATNLAGKAIEGIGNIGARIGGNGGGDVATNSLSNAPLNINNTTPATQIYNMIGRTEGNSQAEQARTADYLVNAAQEAEIVPNANTQTANTGNTALYNQLAGNSGTTSNNTLANTTLTNTTGQNNTGYFQTTGDYWTDLLARAMSSAIDADDVTAFAALYGMYQDQLANLKKQNSNTSNQKLTATQQRANAAENSLNRIESMTPDMAYNLSNIPVVGGIATLGGNDYEAEAKSLAQQIGYMVSGANIKEEEAYNIGKAYVPQPFDNETVRRNKLMRAREIIQQYQNGVAES